jgi:haloalkane dehalogenase
MNVLRTPEERFADLPAFAFTPLYVTVSDGAARPSDEVRIHYVDEGPADGNVILLLHGEPSWSYLYRHMITVLADAGHRVIAPDLVGFGRSDKPADIADHTYDRHVAWTVAFLDALALDGITWVGQDWGGLIGMRILAVQPDRFARFVAANTALPTGDRELPAVWHRFRHTVNTAPELDIARLVQAGTQHPLSDGERTAYNAPFPDETYKAGPRAMPEQVPYHPDHPSADNNRRAWEYLRHIEVPFLTAFSDRDPIMAGVDRLLQRHIPGAQGQPHTTLAGGGHFLQEDCGPQLAQVIADFMSGT